MDYTFLIGATGLLGRYLLRDLLQAGERVAVLVRPSKRQSGRDRIESILQQWERDSGRPLSRPVCLEGDVTRDLLGLTPESRTWIADHCKSMIHSAAVLTFSAEGDGEPWKTNVGGTEQALATCKETGLRHLHYVSTAYVCGLREGVIREEELNLGQEFRNDYEASKLQAETLVRNADHLDSQTIYRPAVIAGDSQTGYTNTYHGLYLYLKLMSVLVWNTEPGPDGVRDTPVQLSMTGDEPRNIVPVDWVSRVICKLYRDESAHGHTFHLAPSRPITPRQVIEAGYNYFNSQGVVFCPSADGHDSPISEMDRNAHENMTIYKTYEVSDPHFDTSNLHRFAPEHPCPEIDEAMLHRYWKYGEEDRWGKRRVPQESFSESVGDFLRNAIESNQQSIGGLQGPIGLDVIGAAGGQWTIHNDSGQAALRDGIQQDCSTLFRIPAAVLIELASLSERELAHRLPELASYVQVGDPEDAIADLAELLLPTLAYRSAFAVGSPPNAAS